MPSINLNKLLWSTRGKEWGFRFLHIPLENSEHWSSIYHDIFSKDTHVPMRWWGAIIFPGGSSINYVACRCFDPNRKWKDAAGREIPHEMLIEVDDSLVEEIARTNWELPVLNCIRGCYQELYCKEAEEITPVSFNLSQEVLIVESRDKPYPEKHDLDLRNSKPIKNPCIPSPQGDSIPLQQKAWNILNMDVKELPTKIIKYLDNKERKS